MGSHKVISGVNGPEDSPETGSKRRLINGFGFQVSVVEGFLNFEAH